MKQTKVSPVNFSMDEETLNEMHKQMKQDYRRNRSEYLRYLIWKEHNQRRNQKNQ
jgi:Arc/MetJ-type ribon-helix-helix transcriptional regulator